MNVRKIFYFLVSLLLSLFIIMGKSEIQFDLAKEIVSDSSIGRYWNRYGQNSNDMDGGKTYHALEYVLEKLENKHNIRVLARKPNIEDEFIVQVYAKLGGLDKKKDKEVSIIHQMVQKRLLDLHLKEHAQEVVLKKCKQTGQDCLLELEKEIEHRTAIGLYWINYGRYEFNQTLAESILKGMLNRLNKDFGIRTWRAMKPEDKIPEIEAKNIETIRELMLEEMANNTPLNIAKEMEFSTPIGEFWRTIGHTSQNKTETLEILKSLLPELAIVYDIRTWGHINIEHHKNEHRNFMKDVAVVHRLVLREERKSIKAKYNTKCNADPVKNSKFCIAS